MFIRFGEFPNPAARTRGRRWMATTHCLASLLLVLLPSASIQATETLWYRTLGVEDGLSQNFVTAIAQDRDGFMWFGTAGGLSRWDGYQFQNYLPAHDEANSLSDSVVLALHAARDGKLWVGTRRGLDSFDPAAIEFRRYAALFSKPDSNPALGVEAITSDRAGRIWFASYASSRLYLLDPRTGRGGEGVITGVTNHSVSALYVDQADRLWVALETRVNTPGRSACLLMVFEHCSEIGDGPLPNPRVPFSFSAQRGKVTRILEDNAHRLWFGCERGGLVRFDPRTDEVCPVPADSPHLSALTNSTVRGMGLDPAGKIWVLIRSPETEASHTPDRLLHVDADTLTARPVELRRSALFPGDDARMERLAIDRSGLLWLGSNGGGLRYANVSASGFSLYAKALGTSTGLASSFVRAICESRDGRLWVGTPLGLNRIDRSQQEAVYSCPSTDGSIPLPNPNVQAICEDREGNLWVGTGSGLAVREKSSGQVRYYRHDETQAESIGDDYVLTIHQDPQGRLWFGTLGKGLDEFDQRTRSFRHYPGNRANRASLPSDTVLALYTDSRHRLWIGTTAGLAKLEAASTSEPRLERIAFESGALEDVGILSICESPATPDVLWLGTQQDGLCRLDLRTDKCRFYTIRNSHLPNDTVYGILVDKRGRLWLSSNRGLTCYDPARDSFRSYDSQDGLQSSEFNARAYFQSPRGEMFFGGVKGLNSFFPEAIEDNQNPPSVSLTEVRVTDRESRNPDARAAVIYRRGMAPQAIEVPFRRRDITFAFVALHYSDPERNRCQYQLEPYDRDWHGPTAQRQARYTNLDPGRYTFRVKARSSAGVWSAGEATFSFVLLPPFYATGWFRVLTAFGVLASLVGAHRWRTYALRRRQKELARQVTLRTEELRNAFDTVERQALKLKELDSAKSKFFANISHEFRTPLMLTLGPLRDVRSGMHGTIPEEALEEIDLAIRSTGRQLELVDQLLMLARLDAGQLEFRPRELRLDEFLRHTAVPFWSAAKRQGIRFELALPDGPVCGLFDDDKLKQVVDNLLGNALKFTPSGGTVSLTLATTPDGWASIQVADTGPGIPPQDLLRVFERFYRGEQENGSLPGTGLGLALVKECVELHHGQIRAQNQPSGGACFTVRLRIRVVDATRETASSEGADPSRQGRSQPPSSRPE
jgi:signal transduction histidine kinase/streptogramin lyase